MDNEIAQEIQDGILDHLMNPRNYGKIDDPSAVGVGYSDDTGEYVLMYLKLEDDKIKDVKYMAQGCTDTIVSGSIFTQMISDSDIEFGNKSAKKLLKDLQTAPPQKRACAEIVIKAYEAAIINKQNKDNNQDQELHKLAITNSCESGNV
jgi:nitrogen fixation NifU-like protein